MEKRDFPIFDEGDRAINDVTMNCNDCDAISKKIVKAENDYNVKKKGASVIRNEDSKRNMLNRIEEEYGRKIDRLKDIKKRNCREVTE